jgi:hypothetical protein
MTSEPSLRSTDEEPAMKLISATACAALLALCAATAPAWAHEQVYTTELTGAAEFPPNASAGVGTAVITFDLDLFTMRVQTSFSQLTGDVAAAHIHCCTLTPGTENAGVATQLPSFLGFPLGGTSGTYDATFDMALASSYNPAFITGNGGSVSTAFSALLAGADAGKAYLNIHSTFAPGGEIRGFLAAAPVPEPGTYALLLSGLAVVGWAARRHKQVA